MEGWVDLGYPAMHRPGTELAISRSRLRRPTTTLTEQPGGLQTVQTVGRFTNTHSSSLTLIILIIIWYYGLRKLFMLLSSELSHCESYLQYFPTSDCINLSLNVHFLQIFVLCYFWLPARFNSIHFIFYHICLHTVIHTLFQNIQLLGCSSVTFTIQ